MIKEKQSGLFIVISGPSGAGKSTITKELIQSNNNLKLSISMTTRKPRIGEVDGREYYFVSEEEFKENIRNNNFLEYAIVHHDNYYGTPKASVEKYLTKGRDVILEIDINGALQIKENHKKAIFIFVLPPNMEELKRRLIKRGTESKEKILERFKTAYREINEITNYNYVIINDDLEIAVNKVKAIIEAEYCRVERIEEVIHEELIEE